jgi:GNAT superfamily N-acetyltransferase
MPVVETVREYAEAPVLPGLARLKTCWWEEDGLTKDLDLGLATDRDTREQAFRLVHDQYVSLGYMDPHPSGWRLSLHNALPSTKVFVARAGRRVVGTVTLIPDSPLGLPMGEIYEDELRALRHAGRRLAEASALVVHQDYKRYGIAIPLRLVRMMVIYAAEVARLSDLCIAINPHHLVLYRKAFNFQVIGEVRRYRKVNGAPAVALRLDLDLVRALVRELRDGHAPARAVYSFLFGPESCREVLGRLAGEVERAAMTREQFEYFFSRHHAWLEASPAERAHVLSWHGGVRRSQVAAAEEDDALALALPLPMLVPAAGA